MRWLVTSSRPVLPGGGGRAGGRDGVARNEMMLRGASVRVRVEEGKELARARVFIVKSLDESRPEGSIRPCWALVVVQVRFPSWLRS